jgi:hypothetical protein
VAIPLAKLEQIRCCIIDCMNPADFTRLRITSNSADVCSPKPSNIFA